MSAARTLIASSLCLLLAASANAARLQAGTTEEPAGEQTPVVSGFSRTTCDTLVDEAIARFAQHQWAEAAALARQALAIDSTDATAIDILGSSLFMLDDPIGALRAWNLIGKPRLDTVRIDGLHRTSYQAIAAAIALRPNAMLTAEAFSLAERRLNELPDRASARIALRPGADGFAALDAAIAERPGPAIPRGMTSWATLGLHASVDRELSVSLPGLSGQGDLLSTSWRWWANRPRFTVAYATPHTSGLRGVWRVDGLWESETYAVGTRDTTALTRESHAHAGIVVGDWITSEWRYSIGSGLDVWNARRKAASIGGSLERRFLDDRLAAAADATSWFEPDGGSFHAIGARLLAQSPMQDRRWAYTAGLGAERVSDRAPLGLWPGAGDGQARPLLLRAHPLIDGGVVDATSDAAFGRTLSYANAEMQRWMNRRGPVRFGFATFADAAIAGRRATNGRASGRVDVGAGLRIKLPSGDRILRIDAGHGLSDGANAVTVGWLY